MRARGPGGSPAHCATVPYGSMTTTSCSPRQRPAATARVAWVACTGSMPCWILANSNTSTRTSAHWADGKGEGDDDGAAPTEVLHLPLRGRLGHPRGAATEHRPAGTIHADRQARGGARPDIVRAKLQGHDANRGRRAGLPTVHAGTRADPRGAADPDQS